MVDTEDASISISHLGPSVLSEMPDDQLSFTTAMEAPKAEVEKHDADFLLPHEAETASEDESPIQAQAEEDSQLLREPALPADMPEKRTWRQTYGVPKPIVTIATILTALSFVLDMIPKVIVPPIQSQTTSSALAADIIISRPQQEASLALDLSSYVAQAASSQDSALALQPAAEASLSTTAIFLLLAFVSVYSLIRNILDKRNSATGSAADDHSRARSATSKRKVRIRTVSPAVGLSNPFSIKEEDLQDALLASRKRPSPVKAEALDNAALEPRVRAAIPRSPAKINRDSKPAIIKPLSRSPSPALTETPVKQKQRAATLSPGSDRLTRSMTRARIASATIEASSPTAKASAKGKSRKQAAILSDSGTEQPGEECLAEEPVTEKRTKTVEKRSSGASSRASVGCVYHIVHVSGKVYSVPICGQRPDML